MADEEALEIKVFDAMKRAMAGYLKVARLHKLSLASSRGEYVTQLRRELYGSDIHSKNPQTLGIYNILTNADNWAEPGIFLTQQLREECYKLKPQGYGGRWGIKTPSLIELYQRRKNMTDTRIAFLAQSAKNEVERRRFTDIDESMRACSNALLEIKSITSHAAQINAEADTVVTKLCMVAEQLA